LGLFVSNSIIFRSCDTIAVFFKIFNFSLDTTLRAVYYLREACATPMFGVPWVHVRERWGDKLQWVNFRSSASEVLK